MSFLIVLSLALKDLGTIDCQLIHKVHFLKMYSIECSATYTGRGELAALDHFSVFIFFGQVDNKA